MVKNLPANIGDVNLISGLGEGNGKPCQYSCQDNPMDRGAWQATFHGVIKTVRHDLVTKQQPQFSL